MAWKQKDPRHKMDSEVRGINNTSADYLSREKCEIDSEVNDEDQCFERLINSIQTEIQD